MGLITIKELCRLCVNKMLEHYWPIITVKLNGACERLVFVGGKPARDHVVVAALGSPICGSWQLCVVCWQLGWDSLNHTVTKGLFCHFENIIALSKV